MKMTRGLFRRWLRFNLASSLGIGVQLAVLTALVRGAGFGVALATALAVECAVLHNFFWHERVTWRRRTANDRAGMLRRILKSHLSNGLISIIGNVALMHWLTEWGVPLVVANLAAIGACSLVNFAASEWFVFAPPKPERRKGEEALFV